MFCLQNGEKSDIELNVPPWWWWGCSGKIKNGTKFQKYFRHFFHVQKKIRWLGPRQKTAALFFLRCVSSFRLRWIISLEWLKIEKSDVWISNYSVFLSDLSDLSPMLERLYKQVEQPSCSERKSAPITDHRSLPTNHRIIEEHQVEQARIFKRKRRVSTLNSRSSAFVTEQRFSDRIFCAQSIIFYQFSVWRNVQ